MIFLGKTTIKHNIKNLEYISEHLKNEFYSNDGRKIKLHLGKIIGCGDNIIKINNDPYIRYIIGDIYVHKSIDMPSIYPTMKSFYKQSVIELDRRLKWYNI